MGPNDYYQNYYAQQDQQPQQAQKYSKYEPQTATAGYNQNYNSPAYSPRPNSYGNLHQRSNNSTWNGSYEAPQDNSHGRAAEALRNLSNNAYHQPANGAVSSPAMTAATTATHRYGPNLQQGPGRQTPPASSYPAKPTRPASTPAQAPSAPRNGLPMPASVAFPSQAVYSTANQRTGSPAQYARNPPPPSAHHRGSNDSGSNEYRQSAAHVAPSSASQMNYPQSTANSTQQAPYQPASQTSSNVDGAYTNSSMQQTIDPIQVYDPWPEIQRKQAAERAAKAAEDAVKAEAARKRAEEDVHLAEIEKEKRKLEEEDRKKVEEEARRTLEEEKKKEEDKKAQAEEKKRKRAENKKRKAEAAKATSTVSQSPAVQPPEEPDNEEEQIRALMAKMRQYNTKNPALLAKIWEEERKQNASSAEESPTITNQGPPPPKQPISQEPPATVAHNPGPLATASSNYVQPAPPTAHNPVAAASPVIPAPSSNGQISKPTKPSAGAVWPPEKREALAVAASKWLNAREGFQDKSITAKEICDKLDKNPTYIELCEWFESRGLKLDRAAFARYLLEAVPDVNSASRQQAQSRTTANKAKGTAINQPSTVRSNNWKSKPPPAQQVPPRVPPAHRTTIFPPTPPPALALTYPTNHNHHPGPAYHAGGHVPAMSSYPPPVHSTITNGPYFRPELPPFPGSEPPISTSPFENAPAGDEPKAPMEAPKSKEEAARKRNFSDLIDLTQYSDDEIPQPMRRSNIASVPSHMVQSAPPPTSNVQNFSSYGPPKPSHTLPSQQPYRPLTTTAFHPQPPSAPPILQNAESELDVVKPIDRKKALRKSTYNPKTIARDVLLATGRHPDMRALNAHLDILKTTFRHVDNSSDLSTFRWDLVDPGQPPKEMLSNVMETAGFADDEEDEEEDRELETRARPMPAVQQAVTADGNSVVTDTSTTAPITPLKGVPRRRGRPAGRRGSHFQSRPLGFGHTEREPSSVPTREQQASNGSGQGRSGGTYSHFAIGQSPVVASSQVPASTPGSASTGYSAFRQATAPDGTPLPKKKGRPVGWRKHIHGSAAAQARVVTRTPTQSSTQRTSSLAKNPNTIDDSPPKGKEPGEREHFDVFKCEWKNCSAELHNLNTLRRHVYQIHNKQAAHGGHDCLWVGCGQDIKVRDRKTGVESSKRQFLDFTSEALWKRHVELTHIAPVAWRQGDGPASGLSDANDSEMSEAYLSDSRGRRVTPKIPDNPDPNSSRTVHPDQPRGRGWPPKRPVEEQAREAQRAIEDRKRSFAPGIDRSGSRLVTEKRRMGLVDDEDVEEIVDMEE